MYLDEEACQVFVHSLAETSWHCCKQQLMYLGQEACQVFVHSLAETSWHCCKLQLMYLAVRRPARYLCRGPAGFAVPLTRRTSRYWCIVSQ